MNTFTPLSALAGGVLIGLSAVILFAGLGRIAGISNMAHQLVDGARHGRLSLWRLVFLLGMVLGASGYIWFTGAPVQARSGMSPLTLIAAGLLVGFGTSMGNGCTSGHGVCGLGRLSLRSLVAVMVFMATGGLTVWVVRHLLA
jgi:uncharacterized membrane protein YedE/YeeE